MNDHSAGVDIDRKQAMQPVTFKVSYSSVIPTACVAAIFMFCALGLISVAALWQRGPALFFQELGSAVVAVLCIPVGFGFVISLCYYFGLRFQPVELSKNGIDGYDLFGTNVFVPWDRLFDCRFINITIFRYVTVRYTGEDRPLAIPTVIANSKGFYEALRQFAGSNHPLVEILRK